MAIPWHNVPDEPGAKSPACKPSKTKPWFDRDAADRICDWFTCFAKGSKGEWSGKPLELQPWQRHILRAVFGWKRPMHGGTDAGTRLYRRLDLWVPRKNGKTELIAALVPYLVGHDGEPAANVFSIANDKDQAALIYAASKKMIECDIELKEQYVAYDSTKAILHPNTGSAYQALSAEASNKDGLNPSAVLMDEIHEYGDEALWSKMTTASGSRRQPLHICISTAGAHLHNVGRREYLQDKAIADDPDGHPVKDRLVVIYEAPEKSDWRSETTWARCNPGFGVTVKPDFLRSRAAECAGDPAAETRFRRYFLNQWIAGTSTWVELERWDMCGPPFAQIFTPEQLAKCPMWMGMDLSQRGDLTATARIYRVDATGPPGSAPVPSDKPTWAVRVMVYVPGDAIERREARDQVPYRQWAKEGWVTITEGNVVDYHRVRDDILRWAREAAAADTTGAGGLRQIGYDPYNATAVALDLQDHGLDVVEVAQSIKLIASPTKELKSMILSGQLAHDGNPVLRWMITQARAVSDSNGNERLTKRAAGMDGATGGKPRIDGLVAIITGLQRALVAETERSPYEDRGVLVI